MRFFDASNAGDFVLYIVAATGIFLISVTAIFVFVQKYFKWTNNRNKQTTIAIWFFMFSLFFSFINFISYRNSDLQENVLLLNLDAIGNKIESNDAFVPATDIDAKKYEEYFTYIKGQKKKLNVILVFAESFSTVDSKRAGGLYNNFPLFDKVQAEGIMFKNFMANGCTSETAHIALLQGVEPRQLPIEKAEGNYYNYANYTNTLPEFFNSLAYKTIFLSTVTLDFLEQRDFLNEMKFQNIIGEEAFKNEKKYVFDAAPDHVLYNKALQLITS
jgi:phosphoglycerol transferase MdoB-like AlkP superfamily enzyme